MPTAAGPAAMVDADHPAVLALARAAIEGANNPRERAVKLYYAVRDGIRYDPYRIDLSVQGLKASQVLADGFGWCVPQGGAAGGGMPGGGHSGARGSGRCAQPPLDSPVA